MTRNQFIKQVFKKLTLPAVLLALVIFTISAIKHKRSGYSTGVSIELLNPVEQSLMTESNIYDLLTEYSPALIEGSKLSNVDLEMLELYLAEDPSISEANVYFDVTERLNVKVTQKEPILRVQPTDATGYYLDKNGSYIPLSKHVTIRVPVITGTIDPHFDDFMHYEVHNLKDVFVLAKKIEADDFFNPLIEQLHVSDDGNIVLVPKIGDQLIQFGKLDRRVGTKLRNLKAFYKDAIAKKGWDKYSEINLMYEGQIVCTKQELNN